MDTRPASRFQHRRPHRVRLHGGDVGSLMTNDVPSTKSALYVVFLEHAHNHGFRARNRSIRLTKISESKRTVTKCGSYSRELRMTPTRNRNVATRPMLNANARYYFGCHSPGELLFLGLVQPPLEEQHDYEGWEYLSERPAAATSMCVMQRSISWPERP